ncbi:hypothetical protein OV208_21330 [Corallococcus sp. bb12-1]|uniref:hypothetical protein n=1 Tax=Corallococcus sp. bb12-1 TaxID=2996784 RepID=UPI00226F2E6B|nr:hypothetical protein [Corallococcus sp. bb12-1]MCY1043874.1 hypothetical protein [Corallococcus sp. bb12-1]
MRNHQTAALLALLLLGGPARSAAPKTPKPPAKATAPTVSWLYQDALAAPWADLTWAGTHSLAATAPDGQRAISVTLGGCVE